MEKYNLNRDQIRNGDLILFRGDHMLGKLIQKFDEAYYNHIGMVFKSNDRLFILDSNANGVNPDFLSDRIKKYTDFCILRPTIWSQEQITIAVQNVMDRAEDKIKYDFDLLLQIAIYRKTGLNLPLNTKNKDICSEFARRYLRFLDPAPSCFEKPPLPTKFITPWDFVIYVNNQFSLILDESDKSKYRKQ
jgi:hypothetical protein